MVELVLVLLIMAILASIAIPVYTHFLNKARAMRAVAEIHALEKEVMMYEFDSGELPSFLDELHLVNVDDPWGNPYQYVNLSVDGPGAMRKDRFLVLLNSDYDLYSMGADGESQLPLDDNTSWDDIVRGDNGRYVGLASEF